MADQKTLNKKITLNICQLSFVIVLKGNFNKYFVVGIILTGIGACMLKWSQLTVWKCKKQKASSLIAYQLLCCSELPQTWARLFLPHRTKCMKDATPPNDILYYSTGRKAVAGGQTAHFMSQWIWAIITVRAQSQGELKWTDNLFLRVFKSVVVGGIQGLLLSNKSIRLNTEQVFSLFKWVCSLLALWVILLE